MADLFQRLQEQPLALWPVVLQQHHHVAEGQVVAKVCEGAELVAQNGEERKWVIPRLIT